MNWPVLRIGMVRSRMRPAVAALLLGAVAMNGCGTAEPSSISPTPVPSTSTPATPPTTPTPAPSSPEPTPSDETATPAPSQFPPPAEGQAVYDVADVLDAATEASLEAQLDGIETDSGMSVVLYLDLNPDATLDNNLDAARALVDQWQIGGTTGDGLVILVSLDETKEHGILSTYAGAGMLALVPEDAQTALRDEVMIPTFRVDGIPAGIVAGIQYLDDAIP